MRCLSPRHMRPKTSWWRAGVLWEDQIIYIYLSLRRVRGKSGAGGGLHVPCGGRYWGGVTGGEAMRRNAAGVLLPEQWRNLAPRNGAGNASEDGVLYWHHADGEVSMAAQPLKQKHATVLAFAGILAD